MKITLLLSLLIFFPAFLMGCEPPETEEKNRMPNYAFFEMESDTVSLEEALRNASSENKKVLLEIYTEWCGYCRKMANETYPDNGVQKALNEYFYYVRLDAESDEQVFFGGKSLTKRQLAIELGATGYPTTVFLTPEGEPLGMQPGFIDARTFEKLLVYVAKDAYQHTSFQDFSLDS